jgi:DNA-binding IclR family transcriptional regulator
MRTSTAGQSVIDRAFTLLAAFSPTAPELTLDQLARQTRLSRSTVHRLAGQLTEQGALSRTPSGWRLGTRLFELGQLVPREQRLRELALPYMQDLYAVTGETIQLAVADRDEVLYVEIIGGHRRVATPSRRGGRMPLHCTALGKALLAFDAGYPGQTPGGGRPLERFTDNTITDAKRLERELHDVRRLRVAYDRQEAAEGLCCVASPVLDGRGNAAAAISVSIPAAGRQTPGEIAPAVQTVARALSRAIAVESTSPRRR